MGRHRDLQGPKILPPHPTPPPGIRAFYPPTPDLHRGKMAKKIPPTRFYLPTQNYRRATVSQVTMITVVNALSGFVELLAEKATEFGLCRLAIYILKNNKEKRIQKVPHPLFPDFLRKCRNMQTPRQNKKKRLWGET